MAQKNQNHVHTTRRMLQITYGILFLAAGVDKFFEMIVMWRMYVSPLFYRFIPVDINVFMGIVGVFEVLLGLMILTRWPRLGAYIAAAWLVVIAINLVTMGMFFDIAVRDCVMAIGALALAQLTPHE